ncbi:hypothetical protein MMC13_001607 [Lambiella insularis]|nr:hypothetical protein [Lambiella insularis]
MPSTSTPPPHFLLEIASKNQAASMAGSSVWKTIFVPPLLALALYLAIAYILIPLYRQRARYAHYIPVSLHTPSSAPGPPNFLSQARERVLDALTPFGAGNRWRRRGSQMSADSMFGDEELEEGFGIEGVPRDRPRRGSVAAEDRRLSRDLEVGFRDDSDDEDRRDLSSVPRTSRSQGPPRL